MDHIAVPPLGLSTKMVTRKDRRQPRNFPAWLAFAMAVPLLSTARFSGHKGPIYALVSGSTPGTFLSASGDGTVVRWDVKEPSMGVVVARIGRAIYALHLHGYRLYIGDVDGGLHVLDLATREETQLERAHTKGIFAFAELPDGGLAVAGGDGYLSIWRYGTGTQERLLLHRKVPLSDDKLRGTALSADGSRLAVACGDGTIRILDPVDLNERSTLPGHPGGANCLAWHPTKPVLLSGGKDGQLRFWHSDADPRPLQAIAAHRDTIYAIAFSADGRRCATASRDKTAKVWDAGSFDAPHRLDRRAGGHAYSVNAVLWQTPDTLLTAGDDKSVVAWTSGDE